MWLCGRGRKVKQGREPLTPPPTVLHAEAAEDGAVCLDGTPSAYYFRPGNGTGANKVGLVPVLVMAAAVAPPARSPRYYILFTRLPKFYIHHQGGGWCESLDSCLGRSKTDLGSSKNYPATASLGSGYFSSDPTVNPMMCVLPRLASSPLPPAP